MRWAVAALFLVVLVSCGRGSSTHPQAPTEPRMPSSSAIASQPTAQAPSPEPRPRPPACWPRATVNHPWWPPLKHTFAQDVLQRSAAVTLVVHLDARRSGVVVPAHVATEPDLILWIGRAMPKPISDLAVDELGFSGTLSFSGQPFFCKVPWKAVFALAVVEEAADEVIYRADIPEDVFCPP